MFESSSPNLATAYRLTAVIVGFGQLLAAAEMFALHYRGGIERFLPWRIVRLRSRRVSGPEVFGLPVDRLFAGPFMAGLAVAKACSAVYLVVTRPFTAGFALTLALLLITILVDGYRSPMGGEGADQMYLLLTVSLLVGGSPFVSLLVQKVAILFIALQAVLAYATSGVAKAVAPVWRSGQALVGVVSTVDFGLPVLGRFLAKRKLLALFFTGTVIGFECTFLLSMADPRIAWAYVMTGLAFHISVAFIMGLNCFLFAFSATYPSIIFVSAWQTY